MINSNGPKYFDTFCGNLKSHDCDVPAGKLEQDILESAELIRGKRVDDIFGKLHHSKRGAVSIEVMFDIAKARVKQGHP